MRASNEVEGLPRNEGTGLLGDVVLGGNPSATSDDNGLDLDAIDRSFDFHNGLIAGRGRSPTVEGDVNGEYTIRFSGNSRSGSTGDTEAGLQFLKTPTSGLYDLLNPDSSSQGLWPLKALPDQRAIVRKEFLDIAQRVFDANRPYDCADFCVSLSSALGYQKLGSVDRSTNADFFISLVREIGSPVDPKMAYELSTKGELVFATGTSAELRLNNGHVAPVWPGTGDYQAETVTSNKPEWKNQRWPYLINQSLNGGDVRNSLKLPANEAFGRVPPKFYWVPLNSAK